jgi:hypothetical protein
MVNAEIYKADPNENLFRQSRGMSPNPNEMPWPDPSEKDVVYLAWLMELYIAFGILIGIAVSAGVAVCWKW